METYPLLKVLAISGLERDKAKANSQEKLVWACIEGLASVMKEIQTDIWQL